MGGLTAVNHGDCEKEKGVLNAASFRRNRCVILLSGKVKSKLVVRKCSGPADMDGLDKEKIYILKYQKKCKAENNNLDNHKSNVYFSLYIFFDVIWLLL